MTDDSTLATVTAERDDLRRKVIELEARIAELTAPKPPADVIEEDFRSILPAGPIDRSALKENVHAG